MLETKSIYRGNKKIIYQENIHIFFKGIILILNDDKPLGQILRINNKWSYIFNIDTNNVSNNFNYLEELLDSIKSSYPYYNLTFEVIEYPTPKQIADYA